MITPTTFVSVDPSLESYWRAIILFGRNVASYKFALGKALFELARGGRELIKLEDLAEPFSRHITEHLKIVDKQATTASSRFLDACRAYNRGEVEKTRLLDSTVSLGFNNVIDAFHIVNQAPVATLFFLDERAKSKAIRLTDNLFELHETKGSGVLLNETEARWRLVETAWELGIAKNLVGITTDEDLSNLIAITPRRVTITSCREALNGYQKGRCFYCYGEIGIESGADNCADVDHFFPHALAKYQIISNIDGVWNLVLACKDCNRGEGGKSARVPSLKPLERLNRRNEYLIWSHHPLRDTLICQTGSTGLQRHAFLQESFGRAKNHLLHEWEPEAKGPAEF